MLSKNKTKLIKNNSRLCRSSATPDLSLFNFSSFYICNNNNNNNNENKNLKI